MKPLFAKVGVTNIIPDGQSPVPVFLDPKGLETFAADEPYLLGDGTSLESPVPVVDARGPIYISDSGNPVSAIPITNMPSGDGPTPNVYIPNLQDFWTNEKGLSQYVTRFNVTGPNLVLEMSFLFDGGPFFTITHGSDTLQIAKVHLDSVNGIGCLVAIASGVTSEVSTLLVSAVGGTFGGLFGRVRELSYKPAVAWSDSLGGTDQQYHTFDGDIPGELVAMSIWKGGYRDSGRFSPTTLIENNWILDGDPVSYTTSPVEAPWVEVDSGIYQINTEYRPRPSKLFDITFDEPVPAPLYWDFGVTTDPGSVTYSGIGDVTQNNNWVSSGVIGGNVTQMQERYNQVYTGAKIEGYGNTRIGSIQFYANPIPYGCSIHRQADQQKTEYRNFYGRPWVALVVCLVEA
jgi:hypothetical protein